jgi:nitrous oxide reductase accessory protein NosL
MTGRFREERRMVVKLLTAVGLGGLTLSASAKTRSGVGVLLPGKGWVPANRERREGDGTPLQFIPKTAPDADPLTDELAKYPRCPYCGMDRAKWHHSRHLVHYDDGLADGTCSIHCLAVSLSLNLDRGPKAIYAADFGSKATVRPLVSVDEATYLIGSKLQGTMSVTSKMAFASVSAAKSERAKQGGKLVDFDAALTETYLGMANDTRMVREKRAERRQHMMRMKAK